MTEVRSVSSTGGEKGIKAQRFELIPTGALAALAEHYGKGAEKYAPSQWRKGYEWSKSYAALQRHLTTWWGGEDIDEETGSSHMAAVAWHAFALLTFIEEHPDFDDRYTVVDRGEEETMAGGVKRVWLCRVIGHRWFGLEGSLVKCARCHLIHDEDAGQRPKFAPGGG